MIRRCELTEMAAKLSLQLEAYRIPDDFDAAGADGQIIARVRDEYTNYKRLLEMLPPCPDGCLPAQGAAGHEAARCLTYDFAHHVLRTEAKQLALQAYNDWRSRRTALSPEPVRAAAAPE